MENMDIKSILCISIICKIILIQILIEPSIKYVSKVHLTYEREPRFGWLLETQSFLE